MRCKLYNSIGAVVYISLSFQIFKFKKWPGYRVGFYLKLTKRISVASEYNLFFNTSVLSLLFL